MATEHDDGLTDEERDALGLEDGATDFAAGATDDAGDGKGDADDAAEGKDGKDGAKSDAGADAGTDGKPAADGADAGATADAGTTDKPAVDTVESAPILVAQAPADAEAKLAEIATAKEALVTKVDEGDITVKEYQMELDKLNKQEREIERAVDKAKLAGELEAQRQANDWKSTVDAFIKENPRYSPEKSEAMYKLLDIEVRRVAMTDEFKNRTDAAAGREILAKANENLAAQLGFEAKPKTPPPPPPPGKKPETIPSLHAAPAADVNDTNGGKYAVLDRLATTNPIAYEEELMKLSESERNSYLATA